MSKLRSWMTAALGAAALLSALAGGAEPEDQRATDQPTSREADEMTVPNNCNLPPIHCTEPRGIYPGCRATCKPNEVPFCLPGMCSPLRKNSCTCVDRTPPPE